VYFEQPTEMKGKEQQVSATPSLQSPPPPLAVVGSTRHSGGSGKVLEEIAGVGKVVSKSDSEESISNGPKKMTAGLSALSIPKCAKADHQDITSDSIKHNVNAKGSTSHKNNYNEVLDSFSRNQNFAEKLHAILSNPRYSSILQWNTNGDAFSIHDIPEFVNTIMPTYFQRSKFDSFTRRMRRWGFRRMERMEERSRGLVIFRCASFRRDAPALCKSMCDDRQLKKQGISSSSSKVAYGYGSNYHRPEQFEVLPPHGRHSPPGGNVHKGHGEAVPVHFPSGHNPGHSRSNWNPAAAHPPPPSSQYPGQAVSLMEMHHPPHVIMDNVSHSIPQYDPYSSFQHPQPYPSQNMHMSFVPRGMTMIHPPPPASAMPMQQDYTNNTMLPYQHHYQHVQSLPPYEHFPGEHVPNQYYMDSYQGGSGWNYSGRKCI